MLGVLLQAFYSPIIEQAKKDQIPILDLSNTFNPFHKLYDSGIEPNAKGGKLIAEGIAHIVKNHDFDSSSQFYAKTGSEYTASKNEGSYFWKVTYPIKESS